jgi:hypothetical protein
MNARKQEIRLQLNQLIDALLLGGVFWLAHALRHNKLVVFDSMAEIPDFKYFLWMLAVIMPFGPFLLELQGYYNYTLEKTIWKSLEQITRAGLWLTVLLGVSVLVGVGVPVRVGVSLGAGVAEGDGGLVGPLCVLVGVLVAVGTGVSLGAGVAVTVQGILFFGAKFYADAALQIFFFGALAWVMSLFKEQAALDAERDQH